MKLSNAVVLGCLYEHGLAVAVNAGDSNTLYDRAIRLMEDTPLIDTHVDLPQVLAGLSK